MAGINTKRGSTMQMTNSYSQSPYQCSTVYTIRELIGKLLSSGLLPRWIDGWIVRISARDHNV
jgi:hypothetical protein